jgi:hypothetical protein
MKFIITFIVLAIGVTSPVYAEKNISANEMIKTCLDVNGYNRNEPDPQKRLDQFDFNKGASCVAGFRHEEYLKNVAQIRKVKEEKPWLAGPRWRHNLYSEYDCSKVWNDQAGMKITVCAKPYFLDLNDK